ncbi:MAG: hypothetical protein DRI34_10150 [Deltaproteobacteria bacterium]|nr:MAG: hypothetical protein DRI34_10150 [Deltaproteobacteria bacterium]
MNLPLVLLLALAATPLPTERLDVATEFDGRLQTRRLSWYFPRRLQPLAQDLSRRGERLWSKIARELGEAAPGRVTVVLAVDNAQMRRAVPQAADLPEWAAGAALGRLGLVLLAAATAGGRDPARVLAHELAHLALYRLAGSHHIPRWFQEGFAQYQADEWSFERARTLAWGSVSGKLFSLRALTYGFPDAAGEVRLAYAQSVDFISFLMEKAGPAKFSEMVRRMVAGDPLAAALEETYDTGVELLEQEWLASLRRRFTWVPLLTGTAALWSLVVLIFLLAYLRRRRQRRRRLEQMEAEERAEMLPPQSRQ